MQTSVRPSLYIYNYLTDSISLAIITLSHARAHDIIFFISITFITKYINSLISNGLNIKKTSGLLYIFHTFLGNIVFISYFCSVKRVCLIKCR